MDNCIFCKIINGEIPSYTIYEDDIVKVFLDINPETIGHMLIIPKKHFECLEDIDMTTLTYINEISKKLERTKSSVMKKAERLGVSRRG